MLVINLALNMSNVNLSVLEFQIQTQLYRLARSPTEIFINKPPKPKINTF
jgi:hypothetical protein